VGGETVGPGSHNPWLNGSGFFMGDNHVNRGESLRYEIGVGTERGI